MLPISHPGGSADADLRRAVRPERRPVAAEVIDGDHVGHREERPHRAGEQAAQA
jgi:hypothetical protein